MTVRAWLASRKPSRISLGLCSAILVLSYTLRIMGSLQRRVGSILSK